MEYERGKEMAKTKYSYKYNGEVVRNSNRLYKYGLVNHKGRVIACSSTENGALKNKVSYLNHFKHQLEWCKKHEPQFVEGYTTDLANTEKWHVVELEVIEN
jgi:hypothetical protein